MKQIKRTAIIGMGALGLLYGEHIANAGENNAVALFLTMTVLNATKAAGLHATEKSFYRQCKNLQ